MGRRRDIEGLRALAVLVVIAYHAGVPGTAGGFIGVDVFFVISGFLITGILLRERESTGRISMALFYGRRARRLLPIATVVLVTTAAVALAVLPPTARRSLGTDLLAAAGFGTNFVLAERGADYLAGDTDPSALRHFWSLAVEEQFYLVWPGLIAVVTARTSRVRRRSLSAVVAVTAASLVASVALTDRTPTWAYFGSHTRAYELAIGAALAVAWPRVRGLPLRTRAMMGWAGALVLAASVPTMGRASTFPGWIALVPVLATAAMIACGDGNPFGPRRLLEGRPMQWIGSRSYSLYLWHWPALVLLPHLVGRTPGIADTAAALMVTVVLADIGYRVVEDPIRRSARLVDRPVATWALASCLVTATVVAGVVVRSSRPEVRTGVVAAAPALDPPPTTESSAATATGGSVVGTSTTRPEDSTTSVPAVTSVASTTTSPPVPTLVDTRSDEPLAAVVAALAEPVLPDNVRPGVYQAENDTNILYGNGCHLFMTSTANRSCIFGDDAADVVVGLLGDSHAAQWFSALEVVAGRRGWRLVTHTQGGCPILDVTAWNRGAETEFRHCGPWMDDALTALEDEGVSVVIVSQYWALSDARTRRPIDASEWERSLPDLFERIRRSGAEPLLVLDSPDPPDPVPECAAARPGDLRRCEPGTMGSTEAAVRERAALVADAAGVGVVDPRAWLCAVDGEGTTRCPVTVGDILVYRDSHHLSDTFVRWLAPVLDGAIGDWIDGVGTRRPAR